MANHTSKLLDRVTTYPAAKFVFFGLVLLLIAVGVGHLYALQGLTDRYLGLPLWIWVQIVVVFAMVGIAWVAVRLVTVATDGGD